MYLPIQQIFTKRVYWKEFRRFSSVSAGNFKNPRPFHDIPSPKGLPIIKNAWQIVNKKNRKNFVEYHKGLVKELGEIYKLRMPEIIGGDIVYISNPTDARELLRNDGPNPILIEFEPAERMRAGPLREEFKKTKGLMSSGPEWAKFRHTVQQDMMRPKSALFYIDDLSDVVDEVIEKLTKNTNHKNEVSGLNATMLEFALEATGRMFIGTKLGVLKGSEEGVKMITLTKRMLDKMIGSMMFPPPIIPYLPSYKDCYECGRTVFNLAKKNILTAISRDVIDGSLEGTIIRRIMNRCGKDVNIPIVMAADALAAGIDTTGNTANFFLYHLASNPEKQDILYEEIIRNIGKNGKMTEVKLLEMRYLKACLQESQRMLPVANMITRRTQVDIVLGGFHIPTGTVVMKHGILSSNNEKLFPNPDSFIPERWIRGYPQHQIVDPFANLPFGHGPRACIGQRFARLELYMLAFKILQQYRLEYDGPPIGAEYIGIGCPDQEIKLRMLKR